MFITDGGMVVAPDLAQKRAILKNALDLCRFLGSEEPKAAVLCAVETVSPHMAETGDGAALKADAERGDLGPCQVEGPIAFDLGLGPHHGQLPGGRSGGEVRLHRHRRGHGPVRTGRIHDTGGRSCPIDC